MTPAHAHPAHFLGKHRTEALVDGIYAVAMTLLELELNIPPWYVAKAVRFRCYSIVAVAALAVAIAWFNPYFGTTAFMLMVVLGRRGRLMEAREAEKAALISSDRPFP